MPASAAPPRSFAAQLFGLLVILVLVPTGAGQCGSGTENDTTPATSETSKTATPTSEPAVGKPMIMSTAPATEPAPDTEPVPMPRTGQQPEPAPVPDHDD